MPRWLLLALFSLPAALQAQSDVALVDVVSGEVFYANGQAGRAKVTPFMKVRDGDRFSVSRGSQVRLLYFQSAQQEHFAGPATFTAGRQSSTLQSGSRPRVTKVPAAVPQRLARIPELLRNTGLGGVQLRGKTPSERPDDAALREARSLYGELRKGRPKDDITPELFLYAVLSDYHRHGEMRLLVEDMLRRQPDNEAVKVLAAPAGTPP